MVYMYGIIIIKYIFHYINSINNLLRHKNQLLHVIIILHLIQFYVEINLVSYLYIILIQKVQLQLYNTLFLIFLWKIFLEVFLHLAVFFCILENLFYSYISMENKYNLKRKLDCNYLLIKDSENNNFIENKVYY